MNGDYFQVLQLSTRLTSHLSLQNNTGDIRKPGFLILWWGPVRIMSYKPISEINENKL